MCVMDYKLEIKSKVYLFRAFKHGDCFGHERFIASQ